MFDQRGAFGTQPGNERVAEDIADRRRHWICEPEQPTGLPLVSGKSNREAKFCQNIRQILYTLFESHLRGKTLLGEKGRVIFRLSGRTTAGPNLSKNRPSDTPWKTGENNREWTERGCAKWEKKHGRTHSMTTLLTGETNQLKEIQDAPFSKQIIGGNPKNNHPQYKQEGGNFAWVGNSAPI